MGKSVHLFETIALALLASVGTLLVLPIGPAEGAATLPPGFTDSPVVSGLTNPTDMEFAPDGRLFITEDAGRLRIAKPDGTLGTLATFLNISTKVDSKGERGLLALTFDPNFSTNHYVYLHYTKKATSTTPAHNRIVRVTANGDKAVAGSEKLIFRLGNQTAATDHQGGALDFDKDGKLYIATGDNARGTVAQQLTNLFGKMLRINKSGTVPTDNPFYTTTSGSNRAIWALGLRNPFKFAIQPGTSNIFINDVGQDNWEEINRGAPGANYGWPICEGAHDYAGTPGEANCEAPPPYTPPIYEYPHEGDPLDSGCSITGGVFYPPTSILFPKEYEGDYFFADFCNGWISTLEPTPATPGEASGFAASRFAAGLERPIDLEVSKAGELYYLARGSMGSPALVGKIGYASN